MRAQEQHLERFALRRRLQAEALAGAGAVLVVIGGLQPFALVVAAALQLHAAATQHQRVFQLQRRLQHVVGIDQHFRH